jgi:hypothetical protein
LKPNLLLRAISIKNFLGSLKGRRIKARISRTRNNFRRG